MPKKEAPLEAIARYIPTASAEQVLEYLLQYKVHLTVTRNRRSVLGDYRHATGYHNHRISINGDLNKYSFLITLIHELAHLVTFITYGNRVDPHGKEWKLMYARLMSRFLSETIFPAELLSVLKASLHNLPASSCSDEKLMRALKRYDTNADGVVLVEQVPEGSVFDAGGGKMFKKGKKLRKRYQCTEIATGKLYLFSPVYEVKPVGV